MKISKKLMVTGVAALMGAGVLAGCGGSGGSGGASGDVELTFPLNKVNSQATFSVDPAMDYTGNKSAVMGTCENLFQLDDKTREVKGVLATEYKNIDDTTWEITIRDGVKFSNGKDLTGEMVKKSLDFIFANNKRLSSLANISSIEANGQKLTIKTNGITATLHRVLSDVNIIIFDTEEAANKDFSKGLIGTGPYICESIDSDGNADLVRNENYWQGKPKAAKVHTKAGLDNQAVSNALQSGEIDWGSVSGNNLSLFEGNSDYNVMPYSYGRLYYLYLNPNYEETKDSTLRDALSLAINRQDIITGVYNGKGTVAKSIFPETSVFYTSQYAQADFNAEQAKKILADGGYTDSNGDGFVEKDGENIKLNILCYESNRFHSVAQVIQSQLKDIGIDSDIKLADSIAEELKNGNYNIATYAYNTQTMGDSYNYMQTVFDSEGTSNFNGFSNPEVDKLIDELKITFDESKRAELTKQMQKYIIEDSNTHIFMMHVVDTVVTKKSVKNFVPGFGGDQTDVSVLWQITKE